MTAFGIRAATTRDMERMAEIARGNSSAPQWTAAQFSDMLTPPSLSRPLLRVALVHQRDGEVYGFAVASALISVFPVEAELESIAVDPTQQGQGIGRHLLLEISWWAMCRRARMMRLEVRASNERALRVYYKTGFRQTGIRPGYYTAPIEDAVLMERTLPTFAPPAPPLA